MSKVVLKALNWVASRKGAFVVTSLHRGNGAPILRADSLFAFTAPNGCQRSASLAKAPRKFVKIVLTGRG